MSPYQIRVIKKGRRPDDAEAEARMHRFIGDVFGLGDGSVAFQPPAKQLGWMQDGHVGGGRILCVECSPQRPSRLHGPIYELSLYATKVCTVCKRRLDHDSPPL